MSTGHRQRSPLLFISRTASCYFQRSRFVITMETAYSSVTIGYQEAGMKIRKKILDYEYEEVLEVKYRELIRVGCAVAVGCPT